MSKFRVKCPHCGDVSNVQDSGLCPKCGTAIDTNQPAALRLYRMGSPIGIAVGFGIYINGQPYGHLGNKESICIPLPFGTYNIHITAGATRRCKDLEVRLTPEAPLACAKARLKMGAFVNSVVIETSRPEDMPMP